MEPTLCQNEKSTFQYGDRELSYLRKKDVRLCRVIDRIGHVEREVDTDLFSSVVHHIVGQQISTTAQTTIWRRMHDVLGIVDAQSILLAGVPLLQSLGMTFRKAEYITEFAEKVHTGAFDLNGVAQMDDDEAIRALCSLKGIGVWTAEMIMLFCLQRPNIFSFNAACEWSITIETSTANCSKNIEGDLLPIAASYAFIYGQLPAAQFLKCTIIN